MPEVAYPERCRKEANEKKAGWPKLRGLRPPDARVKHIEEELGGTVTASYYKEGKPQKETVLLGQELDAGLIVTGGHRRPWYERMFYGAGFAERVTRQAGRPVLVASRSKPQYEAARKQLRKGRASTGVTPVTGRSPR